MKLFPNILCTLIGIALTAGLAGQARAQEVCAPVLAFSGVIQTPPYDPFAPNPLIDDRSIGFAGANCDSAVNLTARIGWGTDTPRMRYIDSELAFNMIFSGVDLTASAGPLGMITSPLNGVTLTLPSGASGGASGSLAQPLRLIIPEGQVVPPGLYHVGVPGLAQNGLGFLSQTLDTSEVRSTPITLSTQVLAVLKLGVTGCDLSSDATRQNAGSSLIDLASACTLNLGDPAIGMANGDNRYARLNARTNVNFKIAMVSTNGGMMRLVGGRDGARETEIIRYSAVLDGQGQSSIFTCSGVNCGSSDTISPTTSPLGTDMYFHVRVNDGDIRQKRAGIYADTITLIIQPAS